MIELNNESYIVGIWFACNEKTQDNWLGCVIRDPDNPKKYKIWDRLKFSNGYEKKWGSLVLESESMAINFMEDIQNEMRSVFPETDSIIVKGHLKKLIELSKNKQWFQMKMVC